MRVVGVSGTGAMKTTGMLSRPARVSREDAPSALVLSPVGLPRAQVHQASGERYGHGYSAADRGARSARAGVGACA